jgi:YVTN family beta-propeller protein
MRGLYLPIVGVLVLSSCSRGTEPADSAATSGAPSATSESPATGTAGRVFVTNEGSGDISVVDVATARVVATIPVGKRPRGIRASADGRLLYVALSGSPIAPPGVDEDTLPPPDKAADGIGVVDVATLRLQRVVKGGSDPEQTAISADGTKLFVANEDVGEVSVIEIASGKVLATLAVGGEPEGVDLRPDGGVVYVTAEEDNQVSVIDTATLKVVATIKVGPRPRSTAFLPDSSRAYVTSENGGSVAVIDARSHKVLETITLPGAMVRPMGVVATADGRQLLVTTGRGKMLVVIDTATNMPVGTIEVGQRPWGVDVTRDGSMAFTANGPSNDISIVELAGRSVKTKVPVGERPWGVVFLP